MEIIPTCTRTPCSPLHDAPSLIFLLVRSVTLLPLVRKIMSNARIGNKTSNANDGP